MAAKKINPISLTEEQIESALEQTVNGAKLVETATSLGFTSKYAFWKFLQKNPEINSQIKQARLDYCEFLEDELLAVADEYDGKVARVKMESICRLLAFRVPEKYGQRLDLNVNQNISIKVNLESSNSRVAQLMGLKDVTPQLNEKPKTN